MTVFNGPILTKVNLLGVDAFLSHYCIKYIPISSSLK